MLGLGIFLHVWMETLHRKDGVPDDAGSCSWRHVVPGATGFIGSGVLPSIPSLPHLPLPILQKHQECDPSEINMIINYHE